MSSLKDQILEMIETELRANPEIDNKSLRQKAEEIDPEIKELGSRAFNARYPLQVKRKLAPPKPRKPRAKKVKPAPVAAPELIVPVAAPPAPAPAAAPHNDDLQHHIRETLLDLARDLVNADRVGLVNVVSGIDDYVARILEVVER